MRADIKFEEIAETAGETREAIAANARRSPVPAPTGTGWFGRLKSALGVDRKAPILELSEQPFRLTGEGRVLGDLQSFGLSLGGKQLHVHREMVNDDTGGDNVTWVVVDPESERAGICGFLRASEPAPLTIGRDVDAANWILRLPKSVAARHLRLTVSGGDVILKPLDFEAPVELYRLRSASRENEIESRRRDNLAKLREIYGGDIVPLTDDAARATLKAVNRVLRRENYRSKNWEKHPGGVLELPADRNPVIVGDLHAQVDNLLKILSEGSLLDDLAADTAFLVLLGDATHKEVDGELEEMDSSVMIMDLIMKLKLAFPDNFFYIRGNHDTFAEEVGKGGVPQGILLRRRLRELRGKNFVRRMDVFFERLPYVVKTSDFVACHAGPTRSQVAIDMLLDVKKYPGIKYELTCGRVSAPNRPHGYTKGDVRRFRKTLGVERHHPVIVGHNPLSRQQTFWLHVNDIRYHHVLFSANTHNIGVFIRADKHMVPLEFPGEPMTRMINEIPS